MRKVILVLGLMIGSLTFAQSPEGTSKEQKKELKQERRAALEQEKLEFVVMNLNLEATKKASFESLYKGQMEEEKEIKKEMRGMKPKKDQELTEEEAQKMIDKHLEVKQKMLNVEKAYAQKYIALIGAQKTLEIPKWERAFKKQLINEMQK